MSESAVDPHAPSLFTGMAFAFTVTGAVSLASPPGPAVLFVGAGAALVVSYAYYRDERQELRGGVDA